MSDEAVQPEQYQNDGGQGVPTYIPRPIQNTGDSILNKHLDVNETIEKLEKLLLGYEYDDESDEWVLSKKVIGYRPDGTEITVPQGPLMHPKTIRITVGHIRMMLNSNTFLTNLHDINIINDIMWNLNKNLVTVFYPISKKVDLVEWSLMWSSIEEPILLGLYRASDGGKTLNAISKMQASHEIINRSGEAKKDEFKLFG